MHRPSNRIWLSVRTYGRCWILLGGAIIFSGCVSDRDIANDPQYPSDFKEDTVYYTRAPLILAVYHRGWPAFTEITGVADPNSSLPPPDKPHDISTYKTYELLPVGTQIRVTRIHRFYAYLDVGSIEFVDSKLASGPHQGTDVKIDAICKIIDSPKVDTGGLKVRNRDILSELPTKP